MELTLQAFLHAVSHAAGLWMALMLMHRSYYSGALQAVANLVGCCKRACLRRLCSMQSPRIRVFHLGALHTCIILMQLWFRVP